MEGAVQQEIEFDFHAELRELKRIKDEEKQAKKIADELEKERKKLEGKLYQYMMDHQVKSTKIDGVGTFVAQATITAYIEPEHMDDFIEWCKQTGQEDVFLQVKHRGKPLNELVRERLEEGEDLPPGVQPKETPYISIRG